ncbi:unnamed protein product [Peronospora belbahrii]|uniref:Uncharacterized protein n=1 Tax=Peronospora belbahrii TaxID=622444 RepID=A0ABN8D070_9STRA|nr:unnamed protein product [Peronospora belbahrii]
MYPRNRLCYTRHRGAIAKAAKSQRCIASSSTDSAYPHSIPDQIFWSDSPNESLRSPCSLHIYNHVVFPGMKLLALLAVALSLLRSSCSLKLEYDKVVPFAEVLPTTPEFKLAPKIQATASH